MRPLFTILIIFCLLPTLIAQGQGTITGFSHDPVYPTTADSITFFVEVSFTSGSCDYNNRGVSVIGSTVQANALHCVGPLAVICDYVDTFKIAPIPAGNYTFDMTLSSGASPGPCSPGFVPDDNKNFQFDVTSTTAFHSISSSNSIKVYPNPAKGDVIFEFETYPTQLMLYNALGQLVLEEEIHSNNYRWNSQAFTKGIYFYTTQSTNTTTSGKLVLE